MDDNREAIEGLMSTHGYEEKEAEVAYHLGRARDLLSEIYDEVFSEGSGPLARSTAGMFRMVNVEPHFRALYALIDKRVLVRDHPERLAPTNPDEDRRDGLE